MTYKIVAVAAIAFTLLAVNAGESHAKSKKTEVHHRGGKTVVITDKHGTYTNERDRDGNRTGGSGNEPGGHDEVVREVKEFHERMDGTAK